MKQPTKKIKKNNSIIISLKQRLGVNLTNEVRYLYLKTTEY